MDFSICNNKSLIRLLETNQFTFVMIQFNSNIKHAINNSIKEEIYIKKKRRDSQYREVVIHVASNWSH